MNPKIYGIKSCDTMKKTFAWFDGAVAPGPVAYELVDRGGTFVGTWRATGLVGTLSLSR